MSSLLPGFEYDIFISYRHNDNRSGWVTQFIKNLQEELAATIKEPVSIYFDSNPHDGILETYNVDKSLEGKLQMILYSGPEFRPKKNVQDLEPIHQEGHIQMNLIIKKV